MIQNHPALLSPNSNSGVIYPFPVDSSCRLASGSSAHLYKTFGGGGDTKTFTLSCWVKRAARGTTQGIFHAGALSTSTHHTDLKFLSTDAIDFTDWSGSNQVQIRTTRLFQDEAAPYHVVIKFDSTEATASDRVKIYVNGVQETDLSATTYPSLNYATRVGAAILHMLGARRANAASVKQDYLAAYLSEFAFIDGTALPASDFGQEVDGIWTPKDISGLTFGTTGFYLDFQDSADLGNDVSGNANDFTESASGLTQMPDTPTNKFATLNSQVLSSLTLSQGNLRGQGAVGVWQSNSGTIRPKGKVWVEGYVLDAASTGTIFNWIGLCVSDKANLNVGSTNGMLISKTGSNTYVDDVSGTGYGSFPSGTVMGIAINLDDNEYSIYKSGVFQGTKTFTAGSDFILNIAGYTNNVSDTPGFILNFGADSTFAGATTAGGNADDNGYGDFKYAPPAGFLAMCAANIPEDDAVIASGTFTGNLSAAGPFVDTNGVPESLEINGNAVTWGTHALKLSNGFKVISTSSSYNNTGSNTYTVTVAGTPVKYSNAQLSP